MSDPLILRAYDLRRRAERRADGLRASVSLHLEANTARRRSRARAMDAEPDDNFVAADSGVDRRARLKQFLEQLDRYIKDSAISQHQDEEARVNVAVEPVPVHDSPISEQQDEEARVNVAVEPVPVSDSEVFAASARKTLDFGTRRRRDVETRTRTADKHPHSDLEYFAQRAAESTRLA